MSMIRVENITFSYPSSFDPVFENVSFQIDTEWKLGLVGRNGRGKTTLLKLLLGEYEYRGKITGAVTFDYFPFPVSDKTQMTEDILRQVCPNARQWELIRELSYLGIESEVLWRPFETMSNGEQTKALLAALFLKEEHFLLIDEPTNHLDVEAFVADLVDTAVDLVDGLVNDVLEFLSDSHFNHHSTNFVRNTAKFLKADRIPCY